MTQPYQLTKDADSDIEAIARYTIRKWGEAQAIRYIGIIEACLFSIADSKVFKHPFPEKHPNLRVKQCERHYIFYLHPGTEKPIIIAILHERMEMFTHLRNRLT